MKILGGDSVMADGSSGGIGFVGLLTIVFIVLKLTGHISWPWIWVLSPIWISFLISLLIIVVTLIGVAIFLKTRD